MRRKNNAQDVLRGVLREKMSEIFSSKRCIPEADDAKN